MLRKQKEAKPPHSSDESIQGKDFDTSTNYVCFFPKHLKNKLLFPISNASLFRNGWVQSITYSQGTIQLHYPRRIRAYMYIDRFHSQFCSNISGKNCQIYCWNCLHIIIKLVINSLYILVQLLVRLCGVKNHCFYFVKKYYFNECMRRCFIKKDFFLCLCFSKLVIKFSIKIIVNSTLFWTGMSYDHYF